MTKLVQYYPRGGSAAQIAADVERAVAEGRLRPGARLPTVRDLAARRELSPATVAAAYRALRTRGIVSTDGRRGTRITHRPPLRVRPDVDVPENVRNLAEGNPDPALLPSLAPAFGRVSSEPSLYGREANLPALLDLGARWFSDDGIDPGALAVVGGALDGIERVLLAHLLPGDRVAVEDPGFTRVLDLVAALGLIAEPVAMDDAGPLPDALATALRKGAAAVIVTPRAHNPTGAALDAARARALRRVVAKFPDALLIEDDHAAPVAGAGAHTLTGRRRRWALVRSVSKALGPDLRLALLAADDETAARVQGRQLLGTGWVSHVLQGLVVALWRDRDVRAQLRTATRTYSARREGLLEALGAEGIPATGRSGLNVWVPVTEETRTTGGLLEAGWAVAAGEPYRLESPPAVRVTAATLTPPEARRFARDLARVLHPAGRTYTA